MQQHEMMWECLLAPGLEHIQIVENEDGAGVGSLVIGVSDGSAFRLRYQIYLDSNWATREVVLQTFENSGLTLQSDGQGNWTTLSGAPVAALAGCIDIDISITPFTNTLPIRRLNLSIGQSAEINTVYIAFPQLDVTTAQQRYTRLDANVYRYESLKSGFTADLTIDDNGFVVDYPAIWKRVWIKS